jgi:23S rRNA (adenine2030-N6)-methyltransferase
MLSYRHGFHAGNFADVLKHLVQIQILEYLKKKDAPFYYHDTHAGSGLYAIADPYMQKNQEYQSGIERIWYAEPLTPLLNDYLAFIRMLNPEGKLAYYPGSPEVASRLVRDQDRIFLGERHTTDFTNLSEQYGRQNGIHCELIDAWDGLKAKLPPIERRGLILIDPSYEIKADYTQIPRVVQDALLRFSNGIFAIWYPVIDTYVSDKLVQKLGRLTANDILHLQLDLGRDRSAPGMHACGMVIINPPYTLADSMKETMPELFGLLAESRRGFYKVESLK